MNFLKVRNNVERYSCYSLDVKKLKKKTNCYIPSVDFVLNEMRSSVYFSSFSISVFEGLLTPAVFDVLISENQEYTYIRINFGFCMSFSIFYDGHYVSVLFCESKFDKSRYLDSSFNINLLEKVVRKIQEKIPEIKEIAGMKTLEIETSSLFEE